jgi:hypothetical protein
VLAYLRPQYSFGFGQPIVVQRGAGGAHARVAGRALDVLRVGKVGVTHIAHVGVNFSERQPCGRNVRLQCHRVAERSDCFAAASESAQSQTEFTLGDCETRLPHIQGLEQRQRFLDGIQPELRPSEQHPRHRLARHYLEYLLSLFCRQQGSGIKQPRRVRKCCLESTDRICRLGHRVYIAFSPE